MTIARIFIDREVASHPNTQTLLSHFDVPTEIVDSANTVHAHVRSASDPIRAGKEVLFITANRGRFIRSCPGTRTYTCCGYQILHIGTYCTMDCAYCILQSYFHPPVLQFFVNHEDMRAELDDFFKIQAISRIGTGEFTDSLIWEPWTSLSRSLVSRFSLQSSAVLELKTKTTAIDTLLDLDHRKKTILAWSLNTPRIIRSEERGTASLSARLRAAASGQAHGYPLAFHFDPLVIYDGCESEYLEVIETLFTRIQPDRIVWISIGTFRFMSPLKKTIEQRFKNSKIVYGEFIPGLDGKMRYFKPLRIRLYRRIIAAIRMHAPDVLVYFCMEDDEVWQKSMGFIPKAQGGLAAMLDKRASEKCGLGITP
ncbi:MAG: DNA photolyase [Deltaproteobacteria bacterium]|nr:MAG: DNA photolyase [Deltaproteobacteria bacterium]